MVKDGLEKFTSTVFKATYDQQTGKWDKQVQAGNQAYKYLKSQPLRDKLAELHSNGYTFVVFPDNNEHLHLAKT